MGWGSFFSDAVSSIGDVVGGAVNTVGDVVQGGVDLTGELLKPALAVGKWSWENPVEAAALGAAGWYFAPEIAAWMNPATGEAVAGTAAGSTAGAAPVVAGSTGTGLTMGGGGLGLTGGTTANLATMGGAQGLTTTGATGGLLGATGGTLAAGGLGAGLGLSSAATGLGTGAGLAGLTSSQLSNLGLLQGGLGLVGGLLGGSTASGATAQQAAQQAALAREAASMGKFQPVGTTTRFGTSSFITDPVTGAITANYAASPLTQGYQNQLAGMTSQGLLQGQQLQGLASQYLGESPEAVRQRYVQQQTALLAPQQEQQLAGIRNNLFQTGRQGLATGATSAGGLAATNPEMAAYYNSLANQQRQIAAGADTAAQQQIQFGQQLAGQAYSPFTTGFGAQRTVEQAAQQPLELSTNLANLTSTAGARQGSTYANLMAPSIANTAAANSYNPWATALQGAASNPLLGYGLMNAFA